MKLSQLRKAKALEGQHQLVPEQFFVQRYVLSGRAVTLG